jgi:hypothetical protein
MLRSFRSQGPAPHLLVSIQEDLAQAHKGVRCRRADARFFDGADANNYLVMKEAGGSVGGGLVDGGVAGEPDGAPLLEGI